MKAKKKVLMQEQKADYISTFINLDVLLLQINKLGQKFSAILFQPFDI